MNAPQLVAELYPLLSSTGIPENPKDNLIMIPNYRVACPKPTFDFSWLEDLKSKPKIIKIKAWKHVVPGK